MVQIAQIPITVNGEKFETTKAAALHYGIALRAVRFQMRSHGLSLEQAFAVAMEANVGGDRKARAEATAENHLMRGDVIDLFLIKTPKAHEKELKDRREEAPPKLSYWQERLWLARLKLEGIDVSGVELMHPDREPKEPEEVPKPTPELYLPAAE